MSKSLTVTKSSAFRQFCLLALTLVSCLAFGQTTPKASLLTRMPASYVPDDDVIVKPIDNELSFYQQYIASDRSEDVVRARNQLKVWNDNQVFASQYGIKTDMAGSAYYVPTQQEKWEYFTNRYLRYLRSKGEQPLRDMPKTWYQQYRASNEVDTIDELEARFKKTNGLSKSSPSLPGGLQQKEVSLWKNTRLIFQPRVDQGLVIVGFKNPLFFARAWTGVNGRTEFNIQHTVDSIGFRAMWNYYTDTGRYFTSVDQRLADNLYARYTSSRDVVGNKDNTIMLLYARQF